MFSVIAIDVGWINVGFVVAHLSVTFENLSIDSVKRVDLTNEQQMHQRVPRNKCSLCHTSDATDRVDHLIQEFEPEFTRADFILLERQPITGLVHVEQLLYKAFRHKTTLCHPIRMHKWLGIRHLDYEQRKTETVKRALSYVQHLSGWPDVNERQHDIADAVCMLQYWSHQQRLLWHQQNQAQKATILPGPLAGQSLFDFMESCKYTG